MDGHVDVEHAVLDDVDVERDVDGVDDVDVERDAGDVMQVMMMLMLKVLRDMLMLNMLLRMM